MRLPGPRLAILGALQIGAGLTLALAVAATLWAALAALGDRAGAIIARGLTWGVGLAWAADLAALVVLSSWAALEALPGEEAGSGPPLGPGD